jgi:hypothetical protein
MIDLVVLLAVAKVMHRLGNATVVVAQNGVARKAAKLTISSPFSTPVSTLGMWRVASSSASCSISCSRSTGRLCLVDSLRWRKRWPVTRAVMVPL